MAKWKDESKRTVEVVKGDTLSEIAADSRFSGYISGTGIYGDKGKVNTLAKLNDIEKPDYLIYVGQILKLTGTPSTTSKNKTSKPTIKAFARQSNSQNTLFATWKWDNTNTDCYRTIWYYDTGDGVWFVGSDSNANFKQSTYSIPSNAVRVRFKVKPIAKKRKVNGKETAYWTAEWSSYKTYNVSSAPPSNPSSAPTVSIDQDTLTLTATMTGVGELNASHIEFRVYKNDKSIHTTGMAKIVQGTGFVSFSCKVEAGNGYKVKCRSYRDKMYSCEWKDVPDNLVSGEERTAPQRPPKFTVCKVADKIEGSIRKATVYLEWPVVKTADYYEIQYTNQENHSEDSKWSDLITGDQTLVHNKFESVKDTNSPFTLGETYYFRVRSSTEDGLKSKWSAVSSLIVSTDPPSAPTTWSSIERATTNDVVTLYWTHNAKDNSDLTGTQIDIEIYGEDADTPLYSTEQGRVDGEVVTAKSNPIEIDKDGNILNKIKDAASELANAAANTLANIFNITPQLDDDDEGINTGSCTIVGSNYGKGVKITWRVRTKGADGAYGEWSEYRTVNIYEPVTLGLSLYNADGTFINDYELARFPLRVHTSFDSYTQAPIGYHFDVIANEGYESVNEVGQEEIVIAGQSIYSKWFDDVTKSVLRTVDELEDLTNIEPLKLYYAEKTNTHIVELILSAGDLMLRNNISYTVVCSVALDSGLSSEARTTFTVSWDDEDELFEPNADISIDKTSLTASIRPYCQDFDGNVIPNVRLAVYRREFDGKFTELESNIDNEKYTYITDPHPALDYARYRIVATYMDSGAISYSDLAGVPVGEHAIVIQWDEDWSSFDGDNTDTRDEPNWAGSMVKLPYNIDVSDKYTKDIQHIQYIGRSHPVSYFGTHVGSTSSWKVDIAASDVETLYTLRRLAVWMGNVYVREPSGSGYWATIEVTIGQTHRQLTIPVNIEVTRVEGGV